ncbi:uncharacterized protein LOC111259754 [Varroa jacobsoni]|uniref:uncharacterized protein LOC111259754 n=1 Tax=Varroa jacobsoni TaxID=62625 RepID=UPI000BF742C5|nr:uncharacterized protein LOC111259754 [Varroa jacobsoni]
MTIFPYESYGVKYFHDRVRSRGLFLTHWESRVLTLKRFLFASNVYENLILYKELSGSSSIADKSRTTALILYSKEVRRSASSGAPTKGVQEKNTQLLHVPIVEAKQTIKVANLRHGP